MGSQRLAAVAAVAHARHFYNHTQPDVKEDTSNSNINLIFASATLCGVLVLVCAACWRRNTPADKPEDVHEGQGVYTVSTDTRLTQVQTDLPGPPPAYESVVEGPSSHKDCHPLQEVVTEPCPRCHTSRDADLPTYEAAVLLKDTKL